ncbi:hypothetical protein PNA2_0503 [Pyrococcus sp. NA2]|uniref:hypothetical protein n=1 Tax=Pyrococcus sp. (strain NA2) TaxID=342949 RepID=UPI000209AAD5|nr:hypothetical protein [Pyrococcus sp. NA2]AEC51420.1 hypothetical protein PNA2_0503 [Pyrococcus sp. NA2]
MKLIGTENNIKTRKRKIAILIALIVLGYFVGEGTIGAQELGNMQLVLVDEKGTPLTEISSDVEVQVQIDALVPTREVYKTVFYGVLKKPSPLKFWDHGSTVKIPLTDFKLQDVLSKWENKDIKASFKNDICMGSRL